MKGEGGRIWRAWCAKAGLVCKRCRSTYASSRLPPECCYTTRTQTHNPHTWVPPKPGMTPSCSSGSPRPPQLHNTPDTHRNHTQAHSGTHLGAAKAGDDAQLQLRQAQAAARRRDARVAAHRDLQPAAERDARDRCDSRLGARLEGGDDRLVDLVIDAAAARGGHKLGFTRLSDGVGCVPLGAAQQPPAVFTSHNTAAATTVYSQRTRFRWQWPQVSLRLQHCITSAQRTWLMSKPAEKLAPEPVTTIALTAGLACAAAACVNSERSTGGGASEGRRGGEAKRRRVGCVRGRLCWRLRRRAGRHGGRKARWLLRLRPPALLAAASVL